MNHEDIMKDLRNGKTINEVCHENNITLKELFKLIRKPHNRKLPKHIYKIGGRYLIRKHKHGKTENYGSFRNLNKAIEIRNKLIENDWNLQPQEYMGLMYIQPDNNGWKIQKVINKSVKHIVGFKTLEEAIQVRDMLVKFNWDLDYLELICKQLGVEKIGS